MSFSSIDVVAGEDLALSILGHICFDPGRRMCRAIFDGDEKDGVLNY
jgi:hypothetical protein